MLARIRSKVRWPPRGLGLGTPLNSALAAADTRRTFWRSLWLYLLAGVATAITMMGLDLLLFSGVSQEYVRAAGAQPVLVRCLIVLYSPIAEELEFRLIFATLVAWIALFALSRLGRPSPSIAIWLSILASALYFGLAHVGNTGGEGSRPPSPRTWPPTYSSTWAWRACSDATAACGGHPKGTPLQRLFRSWTILPSVALLQAAIGQGSIKQV